MKIALTKIAFVEQIKKKFFSVEEKGLNQSKKWVRLM